MRKFPVSDLLNWVSLLDKGARRAVESGWSEMWRNGSVKRLAEIAVLCDQSGLTVAGGEATTLMQRLAHPQYNPLELGEEIAHLRGTLVRELRTLVYLEIDAASVALWEATQPFGERVGRKFDKARDDLEEAAKCLALDRGTACVYHLMCALDHVLAKFCKKVGMVYDQGATWNDLLADIDRAIQPMPTKKAAQRARKEKFQGAHAHLMGVKRAWRNPTMHARRHYTPDQAADVFGAVGSFMRDVAEIL